MARFIKVASTSDLMPGSGQLVEVEGKQIALFNIDGNYYAIDDTCPHRGGPLSEGFIEGEEVACPLHGSRFNIKTGEVLGPPARQGVAKYNTRVVQGTDVEIEV